MSHRISALVAVLEAWPVEQQEEETRVDGFPDGEHGDLPQSGNRETGTNSC